jgi:hypothetical protein
MNQTTDEQATLRSYLLHALKEAEREGVEERILTDKEFGRRVAMAQDDLVDDYVAGRLSGGELESFRNHFLTSPSRAHKLKFAKALDLYVIEHEPALTPGPFERARAFFRVNPLKAALSSGVALAVFGALIFAVVYWAGLRPGGDGGLRTEFSRMNSAQAADSASVRELQRSTVNTLALLLRENLVREDEAGRQAEITGGVTRLRLLLEVTTDSHDNYRAVLQTPAGEELASADNLKAREEGGAKFVVVNVPAAYLKRGAYELRLLGVGADGRATDVNLYPFEITTKAEGRK